MDEIRGRLKGQPAERTIQALVNLHSDEYTDEKKFRIFIGTWNVNGQPVYAAPVHLWLHCDPLPPDVYAIGFQELDLSTEAFIRNDTPREEEWLRVCWTSLHPKARYVKVKLIRLIGMMLIVFVRRELEPFVKNVAWTTVGTGLMKKLGNKGGVAIRMDLHNTSICFVNSHLAANIDEFQRRNQDYHEICSRTLFNVLGEPRYIKDHEQIYWLGDLNYRLDDLSSEEIKLVLESDRKDKYKVLLQHDQLCKLIQTGVVFEGFKEHTIDHMPTYKYDSGTNNWDSSEKNRPPAWCDRVLYKGGPTECLIYRSHQKLLLSDHKPVSCLFSASLKIVNELMYQKVQDRIMKSLDKIENDSLPQVKLSKLEIEFNNVSLNSPLKDTMTVINIGRVPALFKFIPKHDDTSYCKPWLQISPFSSLIMPGDSTKIEFSVFVMENNLDGPSTTKLEDILVLSLQKGKHIFITVAVNLNKGSSSETILPPTNQSPPSSSASPSFPSQTSRPLPHSNLSPESSSCIDDEPPLILL